MNSSLPVRPNLDHLRRQAKVLLSQLRDRDSSAARAFIAHLPEARGMSPAEVARAPFRLADAQSVIARQTGFASWPALGRHVQQLRALEGEWHFVALEVDGTQMPVAASASSRLLIDGDRFRMESPEATYEGIFNIDVDAAPHRIDIEFVEGPEAGQSSLGIFELDDDRFTLCLGLVGATRPEAFRSTPGSGHALERLRRVSSKRPADVTGGKKQAPAASLPSTNDETAVDVASFEGPMTPLLHALEGDWVPVALVRDGQAMSDDWLAYGSRTVIGTEAKVVFGGQVMVHARVRIDDTSTPTAVDYLSLAGASKGRVSRGVMEWVGPDVRFNMAAPGAPRPIDFTCAPGSGCTLSQWRRKSGGRTSG